MANFNVKEGQEEEVRLNNVLLVILELIALVFVHQLDFNGRRPWTCGVYPLSW